MSDRYVVIKGTMFFKDAGFKDKTKRLAEAGLFSHAEADAFAKGLKGDAVTYQPLSFYRDFMLEERRLLNEKLDILDCKRSEI